MLFSNPELNGAKIEQQLAAARKRLADVKNRLSKANSRLQHTKESSAPSKDEPSALSARVVSHTLNEWDWTKSYSKWEEWEDIEELQQIEQKEEEKLESIMCKADNLGHYHDHKEEREFFESPEEVKLLHCERNRKLGNYYYQEGLFPKAAEHYQIAVTYYEYCFPEEDSKQVELDELRHACLCNLSACYVRMRQMRKAVECAGLVIRDTEQQHPKALFRRAQAYRHLDEYEYVSIDSMRRGIITRIRDLL